MKKVGSSLKKLSAIFLGLILLFLLFSMFSGTREGFYDWQDCGCTIGTCSSTNIRQVCNGAGTMARNTYKCKESTNSNGKKVYSWSNNNGSCS
jgi:hypothetical protein